MSIVIHLITTRRYYILLACVKRWRARYYIFNLYLKTRDGKRRVRRI